MPVIPESAVLGNGAPLAPTFAIVHHITNFLQWRFSLLPQGTYRFVQTDNASDERSDIHISADIPIRPDVVGQRPAITVFRSGAQLQGLSIGDLGHLNMATGAKTHMDLIPTNVMVAVCSREPVEAEGLAFHCLQEISAFRDSIIKALPILLYIGNRPSISAPSPAGALVESVDTDWTAVIVSFPAYLKFHHTIEPLNVPIVSGVSAAMTLATADVPNVGTAPLQGTSVMQGIPPRGGLP